MSTYNGERWLRAQLDSVLVQTHPDFVVNVRDDGSTDGTRALLEQYASTDSRVHWTAGPNVGAAESFLRLLREVDVHAAAVAFSDQDDHWESDHLERAVLALTDVPVSRPAMSCSNALVCDDQLRPLRRHDVVRRGPSFANALIENIATGSTIVLNRAAVDLVAARSPAAPIMHDAWCYLVLSALGQVIYDPIPSVRYRLHGSNTMGLSSGSLAEAAARLRRAWSGPHVGAWTRQATEFRRLYGERLAGVDAEELDRFLNGRSGALPRLRYALTGKAHRQRRLGTVAARAAYLAGRI